MSTHPIDPAARHQERRQMNGALLRVVGVTLLSIVFALIHCAAPVDQGQGLTLPTTIDVPAVAAVAAGALDRHPDSEVHPN